MGVLVLNQDVLGGDSRRLAERPFHRFVQALKRCGLLKEFLAMQGFQSTVPGPTPV